MKNILGLLPPYLTLAGAILSFLIPYILTIISRKLHDLGDPPWKKGGDPN